MKKSLFLFLILVTGMSTDLFANPNRDWATYIAGSAYKVATDKYGNVYIAGTADNYIEDNSYIPGYNLTYLATSNAHQSIIGGLNDAFLIKLNSAGQRVWGTFYGGAGTEKLTAVACDADGNIYISGSTNSTSGIASAQSHQAVFADTLAYNTDGFLAKFDSSGKRLWGTYYGGRSNDAICDISIAPDGSVYVTGGTVSSDKIATAGSHQDTFFHYYDLNYPTPRLTRPSNLFVAKFNSNGERTWSTYYPWSSTGNSLDGFPTAPTPVVSCDPYGNVYLGASTDLRIGIATRGTFQDTIPKVPGGSWQKNDWGKPSAFVVKFNGSGQRIWGTYFGCITESPFMLSLWDVQADPSGSVYMTGFLYGGGSTELATQGSHQEVSAGDNDAFLVRFDSAGQRRWSTYYGGSNADVINGLVCDANSNVYLAGVTGSMDNIVSANGFDTAYGRGAEMESFIAGIFTDAFLVKMDSTGRRKWGTYYGAYGSKFNGDSAYCMDQGFSAAVDLSGNIFLCGATEGTTQLATPGSFIDTLPLPEFMGNQVSYLAKFYDCDFLPSAAISPSGVIAICEGDSITLKTGTGHDIAYQWKRNSEIINGASDSVFVVREAGLYSVVLYGNEGLCRDSSVRPDTVVVHDLPEPVITANGNVLSTGQFATYQWNLNGTPIANATTQVFVAEEDGDYTVTASNAEGCSATSGTQPITTGTSDLSMQGLIKVFPNPASQFIQIDAPVAVSIVIQSIDGKDVMEQKNVKILDIKGLSSGVYIIKVSDEKGQLLKIEKLVKE